MKKAGAVIIPTIIAAFIIGYMLFRVWDDLIVAVQSATPSYLILAVVICVLAWFLRGFRYQYILEKLLVRINMWLSTACIYVSQTANLIVPARLGDLVRLLILRHEVDATYSKGLSSLVVERFFDIITIAILGAMALPFALNMPEWFSTVIAFTLVLCFLFLIILFAFGKLSSTNKYINLVLNLLNEVKQASLGLYATGILGVSSIIIWLTDSAICWVIAMMFQQSIPFIIIILAIVIGNLVKAVPLTPGGVGTYELAVALTLEVSGTPAAIATLIAVIDHLVKNLITLAGGIVSLYVFGEWSVDLLKRAFSKGLDKGDMV
ncbi:flippase-like domain-containing protein [Methanoplanus sp. FWC-SCC4]|uniref:Flippase-like domain-containing protein n=2 Tax=Methanochimaera problematica TaxID=2609417 RepID=A0AA97FDX9_9EURY|nr:flippase-like domain-containing protein [Methanoplanus sp. FWC-SCC4]